MSRSQKTDEDDKKEAERGRNLRSDREHLLFAVLVVEHLGALGQRFIPHLRRKQARQVCAQTRGAWCVAELTEVSVAAGTPTPPNDGKSAFPAKRDPFCDL